MSGKAAGGTRMVLIGAVEPLHELLERAKLGGDGVEIFEADDLVQGVKGGWEARR